MATESFNKADSTTLGPDLTWTEVAGDLEVKSNRVQPVGSGSGDARAEDDVAADMYCQVTLAQLDQPSAAYQGLAPAVRYDSASRSYYQFWVQRSSDGGKQAGLYKCVAGSYSLLGSVNTSIATPVANDVIRIEVVGDTVRGLINGVAICGPVTDPAPLSATYVRGGLYMYATDANTVTADSWESGLLIAGVPSVSLADVVTLLAQKVMSGALSVAETTDIVRLVSAVVSGTATLSDTVSLWAHLQPGLTPVDEVLTVGGSAIGADAFLGVRGLVLSDADRQARWAPVWLLRILDDGTGTTRRYATTPLDELAAPYLGSILDGASVEVTRTLADPLVGPIEAQTVALALAMDADLERAYRLGLTGRSIELARYDRIARREWLEFTGIISRAEWARGQLRLECTSADLSILEEQVPAMVVTADDYPLAVDVGAVIPVVFGTVPNVPLRYVRDDKVGSQFDYLVAHGTVALTAAKRVGTKGGSGSPTFYTMVPGEFVKAGGGAATTWAEVARTDLYPGYTAVRVLLRQADSNSALFSLVADVTGWQPERNFVQAAAALLSNATWGLGRAVNAASASAAAALLPAELVCDGAMVEARQAQDWLSQLLQVRGIRLALNADAEFIFSVDTEQTTLRLVAHDGAGEGLRTLLDGGPRARVPREDQLQSLDLAYRLDYTGGQMTQTVSRTVASGGRRQRLEHGFLRDFTAADMVADYLAKRITFGEESTAVALTQEARQLAEAELVQVEDSALGYAGTVLEAKSVSKGLTRIAAILQGIDRGAIHANDAYEYHRIYQYEPGPAPANPVSGSELDYSHTAPAAATGLAISTSGTRTAGDGHVTAYVRLGFTSPTANFDHAMVRYRKNGGSDWGTAGLVHTTGASTYTIESLLPATSYDYTVAIIGAFGLPSTGDPSLTNQTTPTDDSVPSAPSSPSVRQSGAKVVEIVFPATPPVDWAATRLYRNTTNDSGGAAQIAQGKTLIFHDQNVNYATTYYYWAKIEDLSGNISGFSPSSGNGVYINRIVTDDISDQAVTLPKRVALSSQAQGHSYTAVSGVLHSTTLSFGNVPSGANIIVAITYVSDDSGILWSAMLSQSYPCTVRLQGYSLATDGSVSATVTVYWW